MSMLLDDKYGTLHRDPYGFIAEDLIFFNEYSYSLYGKRRTTSKLIKLVEAELSLTQRLTGSLRRAIRCGVSVLKTLILLYLAVTLFTLVGMGLVVWLRGLDILTLMSLWLDIISWPLTSLSYLKSVII